MSLLLIYVFKVALCRRLKARVCAVVCVSSPKVAGSILDIGIEIFH
jgi:hypothetical protein